MNVWCESCLQPSQAEVTQIQSLYEANFPASERKPFESFRLGSDDSSYCCLVARTSGAPDCIQAFALLVPLPDIALVFLEYLAVGIEQQGQGIGQMVFRCASSYANEHGFQGLVWEVEPPVSVQPNHPINRRLRFYEKQGARILEASKGYAMPDYSVQNGMPSHQGIPLRLMQLPLGSQPDLTRTCDLIRVIYKEIYPDAAFLLRQVLSAVRNIT